MTKIYFTKLYNFLLKIIIIIVAYLYIYKQLFNNYEILNANYHSIIDKIDLNDLFKTVSVVFLLMLINWGIETVKWRYLIRKTEKISFLKSYTAVLSGVTICMCMPNRVGEYLGRVFVFEKANRTEGVLMTIIGSLSQLLITIILGLIAITLEFFRIQNPEFKIQNYFVSGFAVFNTCLIILCLYLYFNISSIKNFFIKITQINILRRLHLARFTKYMKVFTFYSNNELMRVLLLSFTRYLVFAAQFYLLLRLFGVELPLIKAFVFICIVFFITTIIPTIGIADPAVRGTIALTTLELITDNPDASGLPDNIKLALFITTTALWFINLIIPSIAGSIFIFKLKFFRKRNA